MAKGKYILLLNPDAILKQDSVEVFFKFLEANDDVGLVSGKILNIDGSLQLSCSRNFPSIIYVVGRLIVRCLGISWFLNKFLPNIKYPFKWWMTPREHQRENEVENITGACLFIRKKVLDQVGYFDENFFMYFEETELCYRIRKKGWKIYYLPNAEILHDHHSSAKLDVHFYYGETSYHYYRGRLIFFKKHRNQLELLLYKILLVVTIILKFLIYGLQFILNKNKKINLIRLKSFWKTFRLILNPDYWV